VRSRRGRQPEERVATEGENGMSIHVRRTARGRSGLARALGLALAGLALALGACSRPDTAGELRQQIDAYRAGAPEASEPKIEALFARLDADIAARRAEAAEREGDARAAAEAEADALESRRRELHAAYLQARFARMGDAAGKALQSAGEAIGKGLEDLGRKMRDSAQQAGQGESAPPGREAASESEAP